LDRESAFGEFIKPVIERRFLMYLIQPVDPQSVSDSVRRTLNAFKDHSGHVPNFMATLAHAPAAMNAYVGAARSLGNGVLPRRLQQKIAIAIAGHNDCEYCLAAHTELGRRLGVGESELIAAQAGLALDAKEQAILEYAIELNANHGRPCAEIVLKAQSAGVTTEELFEVAAHVSMNILSNMINGLAYTEVDFPAVAALSHAA
jgi:AhpD family alkylhydroperoxidase